MSEEYDDSIKAGMIGDTRWKSGAACSEVDKETRQLFFPWSGQTPQQTSQDAAWVIDNFCSVCPVAQECFDFAVRTESTGVWGGVLLPFWKSVRLHNMFLRGMTVTRDIAKKLTKDSADD